MSDAQPASPARIRITGLGRIAEAEIVQRPLTLLVGENNSGKSYLATVVWALAQAPAALVHLPDLPAWRSAAAAVRAAWDAAPVHDLSPSNDAIASLSPDARLAVPGAWDVWAADALRHALPDLLAAAFRAPIAGRVEVSATSTPLHLARVNQLLVTWHGEDWVGRTGGASIDALLESTTTSHLARCAGLGNWLATFRPLAAALQATGSHMSGPAALYFPASRTGYLHLLPDIVGRMFGALGSPNDAPLPSLPAPIVQFLSFLALRGDHAGPGPAADLADLVEARVVGGRIRRHDAGLGQFAFRPDHADVQVPMGRASAVVTELAPLITLLREAAPPPGLLVYEEPEAHLHPRLQRLVAQVLVRLVRRGVRVLVTTHSDTFVQQINNHLKLGAVPDLDAARAALRAELDEDRYTAEDVLRPDDVAAYEHSVRADGRSAVTALEVRPDGVVMPSFNRELDRLTREVLLLDALADG